MLEHIFRNVDDIRVFDLMSELMKKDEAIDIDEIMQILEYNEYKRCSVEDSVGHLIREHILDVDRVQVAGKTGCKLCKIAGKLRVPRLGEHKKHIAEKESLGYIERYFLKKNVLTATLTSVVFAHAYLTVDDVVDEK